MTDKEKFKIQSCRVMIMGKGGFAETIKEALIKVGFLNIVYMETPSAKADIAVDLVVDGISASMTEKMTVVYPFDFIEGGAAMVVLPDDRPEFWITCDIRLSAAKYMSGYCAFWNIDDSDWLRVALPRIEQGKQSAKAQKTAANICAGIVANIAIGRDVKHFPRFYLSRNLE